MTELLSKSTDAIDAARYRKLQRWMSSNVPEGWRFVEQLGAIGCYLDWEAFDAELDAAPVCNVGLCAVQDSERQALLAREINSACELPK